MINLEPIIIINNRIYSIVNTKNIYNRKTHFTYGWGDYPSNVLDYFRDQQSLPESQRCVEKGDYVILFHDRDTGAFGHAVWKDEPSYNQRVYTME